VRRDIVIAACCSNIAESKILHELEGVIASKVGREVGYVNNSEEKDSRLCKFY